jgi:hypothetical protein
MERPSLEELRDRVQQSIGFYGGHIPERAALVWDGYLAALLEWGLISVSDHAELVALLPEVEDNPVLRVFLGWEGSAEVADG